MGILSSSLILYSSTGRAQVALYTEEAKIAQLILKSKSMAIATYVDASRPCGFGFRVDYAGNSYELFQYKVSDCSSISAIDPADGSKYTRLESFPLTQAVAYGNGANRLDAVLFVPPEPKTYISSGGSLLPGGSGNIYLQTADGSASITIRVSTAGQITF